MAQQSSGGVGSILKWGLLGAGGYLLYSRFVAPGAPAVAAAPAAGGSTQTYSIQDLINAVRGTAAPASSAPPAAASGDQWTNAASCMQMAAGSDSQNFDQWSYWFQNMACSKSPLPAGFGAGTAAVPTISADLMGRIIAAGGGDRSKLVSSSAWIGYYRSAAGLSGLGGVAPAVTVPLVVFPVGEGRFAVVGRRGGRPFTFTVAGRRPTGKG